MLLPPPMFNAFGEVAGPILATGPPLPERQAGQVVGVLYLLERRFGQRIEIFHQFNPFA